MLRKPLLLVVVTLAALTLLMGLNRFYGSFLPVFSEATVRFDGIKEPETMKMPIWYSVVPLPAVARVTMQMQLPEHPVSSFFLPHTGIVSDIVVNKHAVSVDQFQKADLGGQARAGTNDISLKIFFGDAFSGFVLGIIPSLKNFPTLLFAIAQLCLVQFLAFGVTRIRGLSYRREIVLLLALGIALRSLYVSVTPWYLFAYDAQAHLDYLSYMVTHQALPVHTALWQAHQAPLYYIFVFVLPWLSSVLGWPQEVTFLNLQAVSLLISIAVLLIGTEVVLSTFKNRVHRAFGVALLAVAPSLIYPASQISNDVFLLLFGFLWYAALQRSVDYPHSKHWMLAILWMSLGILSKGNALLWTVPTAVAFLFFTSLPLRTRLWRCSVLVLTAPLWGSFFLWRFLSEPAYGLIENAHQLTSRSLVPISIDNVWIFNPVSVFLQPYVHSMTSFYRPEYFFESVLRTTQFGTYAFGPMGRYPLLFAILLLPICARGMISLLQRRQFLPVFTALFLVAGLMLFCFRYPYSSSQHFRYIAVSALPLALCIVEGCLAVHINIFRKFSEVLLGVYVFLTALFFLSIIASGW